MKKGYAFLAILVAFLGFNQVSAQCLTAPFTESFDAGTQPTCVIISATSGGPWDFNGIFWNTSGCSPAPSDHTGNSGFFASMDHSGADAGVIMEFDTIDVSALTSPYLEFYYIMCGSGYTPVNPTYVETYNGASWVTVDTLPSTIGWELFTYDLSANTFGTSLLKVRFRAESGGSGSDFYGDAGVDDISVYELPTCFKNTNLTASSITNNSADLAWVDANGATSWEIEYGLAPLTPGTGTSAVVSSNPQNVVGLTDNSDYEWYVRAICAVGDTAAWSGVSSFRTACNPYTASYTNGFDGTTDPNIDPCWTVINTTNSSGWVNTENSAFDPQRSAPNSIEFYNSGASTGNLLLVSPQFSDLDSSKQIRFWLQNEGSTFYTSDLVVGTMSDPSVDSTFEAWDTIPNALFAFNTWTEFIVPFTGLSNGDKYVAFRHGLNGTFDYIFMDDFTYEAQPSCPQPNSTSLAASNLTSSTADLSWVEVGTATSWQIQYDTAGFTPGTGNLIVTSASPYSLTGLTSNTAYDWYVRSICSAVDTSAWSGPNSFRTPCNPFTAPYSQAFDGTTDPNIDDCWSVLDNTANFGWIRTENSAFDPQRSAPNSIEFYNSSAASGNLLLVSPEFSDFDNAKQIRFWLQNEGSTSYTSDLIVGTVSDPTDPATFTPYDTIPNALFDFNTWTEFVIPFNNYLGTDKYVAFRHGLNSTFDYIFLDDFSYEVIPNCPSPGFLTADSISSDSALLNWTENGVATNWQVEWDTAGFVQGTGNIVTTTTKPIAITGLNPATTYDFYVRAICGPADTSTWSSSSSFTTAIQGPQGFTCTTGNPSVVFSDDLETAGGWTGNIGTGTQVNNWNYRTGGTGSFGTGPNGAHSGSQYVYVETSGSPVGNNVNFISPSIDLSGGSNFAELSFWVHAVGAQIGTLNVGVGTSATGPFTNLWTYSGAIQAAQADPYVNVGVNLDAYVGQTIYVQFNYVTNGSFAGDIALDLISVSTCTSCSAPSNLAASNATLSSVDLAWIENGTATTWEVEYGNPGFTPGTGTKAVVTANPYSLTGLPPSTSYDYYVRSICGPADSSGISPTGSFATLNGIPYSEDFEAFSNGRANQNGWNNVNASDPDWTADNGGTTSGGTGPDVDHTLGTAAGIYIYLETSGGSTGARDTLSSPSIAVGASQNFLTLEYWYHMAGASMGQMQVWVESAGVWDSVATYVGPQHTATSDPWSLGSHIITGYAGQSISLHFIGEKGTSFTGDMAVDDVSLTVAPANNLGITNIVRPVSGCGLSSADSVEVVITNYGAATQSNFNVGYALNGVAVTPETVTDSVASGMSLNYTFAATANLSAAGDYTIDAYTLLAGDSNTSNDSTSKTVSSIALVSSFPYTESFESGQAGWRVTGATTFELGAPVNAIIDTASDGTQAWVTDLDANYLSNEAGAVNSPCFDFTNIVDPIIEMDIWWDAETSWDGAVLQSSIDGGITWQKVGANGDTVNWYNDNSIDGLFGIEPSQEGWTGSPGSLGWVTAKRALDGLGGQSSVQLRVAFGSDGSVVDEGFAFDNVKIYDKPIVIPYYPIGVINKVDTNGVADSLNVEVKTSGTVVGIDLDGNNGLSFTIIDMSTSVQEGINIFNFNDVSNYVVNEGDSIMVWGDIIQFNGLQEVFVDSIRIISTGSPVPAPIIVNSLSESTESKWISLGSNFILLDGNGTGSYNMDATNGTDTITIRVDADTDVNDSLNDIRNTVVPGDTICGMLGIGGQFDNSSPYTSGYQIFPMRYSDITICRLGTAVEERVDNNPALNIYPNPTDGMVTISANNLNSSDARIMVRDISGRILFEDRLNNKSSFSKTIDFSDRANGIYFITIIDGDKTINEKLIKN